MPKGMHGVRRPPEEYYTMVAWQNMKQRCTNPNRYEYKYYGERGIKVCDRWLVFQNFLDDMGVRPQGLEIDRIDNDGNYEPGNVRWATRVEQANNQGPNKRSAKLTEEQVREIRLRYKAGELRLVLVEEFNVSYPTINDILRNHTWKNVV